MLISQIFIKQIVNVLDELLDVYGVEAFQDVELHEIPFLERVRAAQVGPVQIVEAEEFGVFLVHLFMANASEAGQARIRSNQPVQAVVERYESKVDVKDFLIAWVEYITPK